MFKRKIDSILKRWKEQPDHKPIVIKGCRQCGKTSSVLEFARKNYKNVVYLDFNEQEDLRAIFDGSLQVDKLILSLSATIPQSTFIPGETCIVFDEIQDCPRARMSLKYFKLDGRFDIICTGSLLGVNGYRNDNDRHGNVASIPVGFETIVDMFPMDYEEWLWANGMPNEVIEMLKTCLEQEEQVPMAIHNRLRELFLQYIVVGGMPEAVTIYANTHDINQVISVQRNIVDQYKADMVKYAPNDAKARIRECFESLPKQLSRENKKFSYSVIRHGGRGRQYSSSLQWIEDAGIIRRCYNLSITELPLSGNAIDDAFKVYMADTGLFVSMLEEGAQHDILNGNLLSYKGAIFENAIADVLGKMGRKLYYFHKTDSVEVDFVMRHKGECKPLECKATNGNAKSLKTIMKHQEKYHVTNAFKIGDFNLERNGAILNIPHYMTFLLTEV